MSTMVATRRSRPRRRPAAGTPLKSFARFVSYLGLGAVIGLGSAWYLLHNGISLDRVFIGPWVLRADAGQPVADPYTSAYVARSGHMPLRRDGAMYFQAETTGDGATLDGACTYSIVGPALSGAWWSISVHDPEGGLIENVANRYSFTNTTLLFDDGQNYRVTISPSAQPGNWLPSGEAERFVVSLRIHGPDPAYIKDLTSVPMPTLTENSCP